MSFLFSCICGSVGLHGGVTSQLGRAWLFFGAAWCYCMVILCCMYKREKRNDILAASPFLTTSNLSYFEFF